MRLRFFDRFRRLIRRRPGTDTVSAASEPHGRHRRGQRQSSAPPVQARAGPAGSAGMPEGRPPTAADWPAPPQSVAPLTPPDGSPVAEPSLAPRTRAARAGSARARIREAPQDAAGFGETVRPAPAAPSPRAHWHEEPRPAPAHAASTGLAEDHAAELARVAAGVPRQPGARGRSSLRAAGAALRTRLPFTAPHARERPPTADGRRNCGSIERILWRQWDTAAPPPAQVIEAVDRLAELPERIKEKLTDGLDAIFVGPGGVPELDEMTGLRGVPLPAGRATWDACAGAYGERKIVVGSQPSPTPDVMCHEVGHALDDLDSPRGKWQSDSAEFRMVYDQCLPHLASDFHLQPGGLGRKEFFADAFAAIASRQRPALVDMLSGDTRTALRVMLYFNRRYGI